MKYNAKILIIFQRKKYYRSFLLGFYEKDDPKIWNFRKNALYLQTI